MKKPEPRLVRVLGGIRNIFTRARRGRRGHVFTIKRRNDSTLRTASPPAHSPTATTGAGSRAPRANTTQLHTPSRVTNDLGGIDQIRRCLNGIGRRLIEEDDRELRRMWFTVSLDSII